MQAATETNWKNANIKQTADYKQQLRISSVMQIKVLISYKYDRKNIKIPFTIRTNDFNLYINLLNS